MPYTKTIWTSGLPLTIGRLNNIESGLEVAIRPDSIGEVATAMLQPNAVSKVYPSNVLSSDVVASTSVADTGLTLTFTPSGGECWLKVSIPFIYANTNAGGDYLLRANLDGADLGVIGGTNCSNGSVPSWGSCYAMFPLGVLSVASHTLKIRHSVNAGTVSGLYGAKGAARFQVIELKR